MNPYFKISPIPKPPDNLEYYKVLKSIGRLYVPSISCCCGRIGIDEAIRRAEAVAHEAKHN